MLVTLVKQANIFPFVSTSTYHRTDLLTSLNICGLQSLLVPLVQQIVLKVLDSAAARFQVKLKEYMYIKWEKPNLSQQVKHVNLTLSLLHLDLVKNLCPKAAST